MGSTGKYYQNEGKLGPDSLPTTLPLSALLQGYVRLPGYPENSKGHEFLQTWWDPHGGDDHKVGWKWPNDPIGGFLPSPNDPNIPLAMNITLEPGTLIDRFGHDDTGYFAPLGTPYGGRSLPPSSLNDPYSVFRVLVPIRGVRAGQIAPGFGQSGMAIQYITEKRVDVLMRESIIEKLTPDAVRKLYE